MSDVLIHSPNREFRGSPNRERISGRPPGLYRIEIPPVDSRTPDSQLPIGTEIPQYIAHYENVRLFLLSAELPSQPGTATYLYTPATGQFTFNRFTPYLTTPSISELRAGAMGMAGIWLPAGPGSGRCVFGVRARLIFGTNLGIPTGPKPFCIFDTFGASDSRIVRCYDPNEHGVIGQPPNAVPGLMILDKFCDVGSPIILESEANSLVYAGYDIRAYRRWTTRGFSTELPALGLTNVPPCCSPLTY